MYKYLLFLFVFCSFFTSCIKDGEGEDTSFKRTVVVYLGRDDTFLSGAGEDRIQPMLKGWNGKNGNLIIYQDKEDENPVLLEAYSDNGEMKTKVLVEYEEENSADKEVLRRVINYAITNYEADSYGLIIFSHGYGWLPEGSYRQTPRGIIKDQNSEMELKDMADAIPSGYFDFIILEACYTAGIEVMYELKDKANYIFGSSAEIVSPGYISIYASSMNYFFTREPRLKAFAENVFNYVNEGANWSSGTFSLIKTSELDKLAIFLKNNIDPDTNVNIADLQRFGRNSGGLFTRLLFFDFEDYFSRILENEASSEFSRLISNCIVYKNATPGFLVDIPGEDGFEINFHSGLTTYVLQNQFSYLNEEYKNLNWYKAVFEK